MTIIDHNEAVTAGDTGAWRVADYTPTPPAQPGPDRSRRNTVLGWFLLLVVLGVIVTTIMIIGTPDSSAAGGCGGG